MPKLLAIDGNSLMHRAFHALPLLNNAKGEYTNAVYGFLGMLLRLLKEEEPDYAAVAFDMHGKTFRHEQFEDYKAGRKKTPEELVPQFDMLKKALAAMDISIIEREGLEGDDLIGCLAVAATGNGVESVLVTGDRDALQLVNDSVTVVYTKRGISDTDRMDAAAVKAKLGVDPAHVTDLKGLMGDSSDNIPGVPGVGEKTALKLLDEYGDLENALAHAEDIKRPKLRQSLIDYADQARMSKELATIVSGTDVGISLDEYSYSGSDMDKLRPVFVDMGFETLLKRMGDTAPLPAAEAEEALEIVAVQHGDVADMQPLLTGCPAIYITEDALYIAGNGSTDHVFTLSQTLLGDGVDYEEAMAVIRAYLSEPANEAVLLDAKAFSWQHGVDIAAHVDDAMLAAYSCDPGRGNDDLAKLCGEYGIQADRYGAATLYILMDKLRARLDSDGMVKLYGDMELPLWRVLYGMEKTGFRVDTDALRQMGESYGQRLTQLESDIQGLAGVQFNVNSPKQLGEVLFGKLGLQGSKKTKSGYSTDIDVLEGLRGSHQIIDPIIEYRKAAKLKSTYMDGLLAVADKTTGKIHTRFRQNITATGRISSTEPNLQNIPVRTEEGREIRRAFVPSAEGRLLAVADYSQIELRILAHMADDENMIANFNRGGDIHASTAAEVFGVAPEDVTPELRSAAKAVNFGIVYGIGDFSLSRNLGITRGQAADYIQSYFDRYPKVHEFMQACVARAKTEGYVETLFGRRRYVNEIKSKNYNIRSFGERIAMNAPIQGTAADIIKLAMIGVDAALAERYPEADMILQVHDELIVDCPAEQAEGIMALLREHMEGVISLKVPLQADAGCGKTWLEAK